MTKTDMNSLTRIVLTAALSMIVTGSTAWMVFGQDKVTVPQMEAYVATQLALQTSQLSLKIERTADSTTRLEGSVTTLVGAQQELLVEQRVLVERVNALVGKVEDSR